MIFTDPDFENYIYQTTLSKNDSFEGASLDEIHQLEMLCGTQLPNFYRWFLSKFGRQLGALQTKLIDFSIGRILDCYQKEILHPNPNYLLIGYDLDTQVSLHYFYDLTHGTPNDAAVIRKNLRGGEVYAEFDTFRDMLAWRTALKYRIYSSPYSYEGRIYDDHCTPYTKLDPALKTLGFTQPIETTSYCRIYQREDLTLACLASAASYEPADDLSFFDFAGPDSEKLKSILDDISSKSGLKITISNLKKQK